VKYTENRLVKNTQYSIVVCIDVGDARVKLFHGPLFSLMLLLQYFIPFDMSILRRCRRRRRRRRLSRRYLVVVVVVDYGHPLTFVVLVVANL
jgi:hypothetical protein